MNFITRVARRMWGGPRADGGAVTSPADLAREMRGSLRADSGVRVDADSGMRVSTVFACVKVIAEDMAAMPLNVYQTLNPGKRRAADHPLYRILHSRPNQWQTSMEFREMLTAWALLKGAGYALRSMVRGQLDELLPLRTVDVTPKRLPDLSLIYEVQSPFGGARRTFTQDQMFVVRGLTLDGYTGLGAIEYARNAIGLAASQEGYGSEAFRDGGMQRLAFKHKGNLSEGAASRLRDSWMDIYGGPGRYAKPAVLEEDMDVIKVGLTAAEMQFLDGRSFQIEDIARFFRVSPSKIGHMTRATNNNVEQMALDHVTSTLLPWCVRWEQAIERDLMDKEGKDRDYFVKHVIDAHLRGDPEKRHNTYAKGRQWGYYSANDVRELEDLNPIEGGDSYLVPVNMRDAMAPAPAAPDAAAPVSDPAPADAGDSIIPGGTE